MGFPTRISRASLGPTYQDRYPVNDATKELGASTANLFLWQLAGSNLVVPLAFAEVLVSAGDVASLGQSAESWDPDGIYLPTLTHPAVGRFVLTYAATYPNDLGVSVALSLLGACPCVQSTTFYHSQGVATAANVIEVRVYDSANNLDDPTSSSILIPIW